MSQENVANYYAEINIENSTMEEFQALALQSIEFAGWQIISVKDEKIIAEAASSFTATGERITIKFHNNKAMIESKSFDKLKIDFGKNKKNVMKFIESFNYVSSQMEEDEVKELIQEVKVVVAEQEENQNNEIKIKEKAGFSEYLSLLKPSGNYFFTPLIIIGNLIVYILMLFDGADFFSPNSEMLLKWGANFRPMTMEGEWWRLLSSSFIHIGFLHLLMNMIALIYIGSILETIIGKYKFLYAYIITGLFASLTSLIWHPLTVSAGASGSIFGLMGVLTALLTTNYFDSEMRKRTLPSMAGYILLNIVIGFTGGIDLAAHLGGLISGFAIGYLYFFIFTKPLGKKLALALLPIFFALFLVSAFYAARLLPNDLSKYQKLYNEFYRNEEQSIDIYKTLQKANIDLNKKAYNEKIIPIWKRNKSLCEAMMILDLPVEMKSKIPLYLKYSDLRLEFSLVKLRHLDSPDDSEIEKLNSLNKDIDSIVNLINIK